MSLDREVPGAVPAVAVGDEGVEPVHGAEGEAEGVVLEGDRLPQGGLDGEDAPAGAGQHITAAVELS